jgi:hypothetical protein
MEVEDWAVIAFVTYLAGVVTIFLLVPAAVITFQ